VPTGVLKEFINDNCLKSILKEFLQDCLNKYGVYVSDDLELCTEYYEIVGKDNGKNVAFYAIKSLLYFGVLAISALYILKWFILGVDWINCKSIISESNGFFQTIGFLTEKGYGINHNCILNTVILFLSVVWTLVLLCTVRPFIKCIRNSVRYVKNVLCYIRVKYISDKLKFGKTEGVEFCKDFEAASVGRCIASTVAMRKNPKLFRNAQWVQHRIQEIVADGGTINSYEYRTGRKIKAAIVLLILAIGTAYFSSASSDVAFVDKVNVHMSKISRIIDERRVYAEKEYYVRNNTFVYTKPEENSLVLYQLTPEQSYYITKEATEEVNMVEIRFFTEYGYLSGWIKNQPSIAYYAEYDKNVENITPAEIKASREEYGNVNNLCDNNRFTSWGINCNNGDIGEYVELVFTEPTEIDVFMIQTGNKYFGINCRPIEYNVEFLNDEKIVNTISVTLDDSWDRQAFKINKSILADKVRFVITDVVKGTLSNNMYIAELAVYQKNNSNGV